jgi:AraC family transcriptional regulator
MHKRLSHGQFYGQVIRQRVVGSLNLIETRYAPTTRLPAHSHQHGYFCLVRRGHYRETYCGRERLCGPLTVAFHPAGEVHAEEFGDDETWSFNIEVANSWMARWSNLGFDWSGASEGGALAGLALRLYTEFLHDDDAAPMAIEGLTLEIMAERWRGLEPIRAPSPPRWLTRVHQIIHDDFAEPLTLAELAHEAGVHPVYVATAFRRQYGCTVGQYLRQRRVESACQQLKGSAATLAQIALAAGFADQSHFSRVFKRLIGVTPGAFRHAGRRS